MDPRGAVVVVSSCLSSRRCGGLLVVVAVSLAIVMVVVVVVSFVIVSCCFHRWSQVGMVPNDKWDRARHLDNRVVTKRLLLWAIHTTPILSPYS